MSRQASCSLQRCSSVFGWTTLGSVSSSSSSGLNASAQTDGRFLNQFYTCTNPYSAITSSKNRRVVTVTKIFKCTEHFDKIKMWRNAWLSLKNSKKKCKPDNNRKSRILLLSVTFWWTAEEKLWCHTQQRYWTTKWVDGQQNKQRHWRSPEEEVTHALQHV